MLNLLYLASGILLLSIGALIQGTLAITKRLRISPLLILKIITLSFLAYNIASIPRRNSQSGSRGCEQGFHHQ